MKNTVSVQLTVDTITTAILGKSTLRPIWMTADEHVEVEPTTAVETDEPNVDEFAEVTFKYHDNDNIMLSSRKHDLRDEQRRKTEEYFPHLKDTGIILFM